MHAGFVKPAEVSQDASIYKTFEAEAAQVDGKISLPDLRIEHEPADGERAHIDLEFDTEYYRPARMSQKLRAGFKIYGVNSTSRGRRGEWEGRELTAQVLAL